MLRRHDEVAGQRQLQAAAHGEAVDRRDHRLVEVPEFGEPGEPSGTVVGVVLLAPVRGLQVPARREYLLARSGDDSCAQRIVVAQPGERLAQGAAGCRIDRVDLGAVERDLQDGPAPLRSHRVLHRSILLPVAETVPGARPRSESPRRAVYARNPSAING